MAKFTKYDVNECERAIDQIADAFQTIEYYAREIDREEGRDHHCSPGNLGQLSRLIECGNGYEPAFENYNLFEILNVMQHNCTEEDE